MRDPRNFTVRKQICMVEHPERFYREINLAWQQEQLAREGDGPEWAHRLSLRRR